MRFVLKFANVIYLKEMQKFARPGGTLENLQTLKQSRLSVSKVSRPEWNFILGLADVDEAAVFPKPYKGRDGEREVAPEDSASGGGMNAGSEDSTEILG